MRDIVIVGAGGFGRELHSLLWDCFSKDQYRFKGFLAKQKDELNGYDIDAPVLDDPDQYRPAAADVCLLAVGHIGSRRRIVESLTGKGAEFVSMIHPTALIADSAKIGKGAVIYPFASVSNRAVVDDFVCIHFYCLVSHDAKVGKYCYLSPYATLNGMSEVEDEVFMGTHSTVTPLRRVGHHAKISANSSAMRDVAPHNLLFGVPGKQRKLLGDS